MIIRINQPRVALFSCCGVGVKRRASWGCWSSCCRSLDLETNENWVYSFYFDTCFNFFLVSFFPGDVKVIFSGFLVFFTLITIFILSLFILSLFVLFAAALSPPPSAVRKARRNHDHLSYLLFVLVPSSSRRIGPAMIKDSPEVCVYFILRHRRSQMPLLALHCLALPPVATASPCIGSPPFSLPCDICPYLAFRCLTFPYLPLLA